MSRRIISSPAILDGTPVFRGTRIPLGDIVALVRKGCFHEIEEDYPSLSEEDIAYARVYARLIPARNTSGRQVLELVKPL